MVSRAVVTQVVQCFVSRFVISLRSLHGEALLPLESSLDARKVDTKHLSSVRVELLRVQEIVKANADARHHDPQALLLGVARRFHRLQLPLSLSLGVEPGP